MLISHSVLHIQVNTKTKKEELNALELVIVKFSQETWKDSKNNIQLKSNLEEDCNI